MGFKNILQVMKYLTLLVCFFVSVSYASLNDENTFVGLTTSGQLTLQSEDTRDLGFDVGVGLGYKHDLGSTNYLGYFLGDINIVAYLDTTGSDAIVGILNLEYGYEFMMESLFSFGLNISPIVFMLIYVSGDDLWSVLPGLMHSIGIFGNFNIDDSFEVVVEIKAMSPILLDFLFPGYASNKDQLFQLTPSFGIKGRYYF